MGKVALRAPFMDISLGHIIDACAEWELGEPGEINVLQLVHDCMRQEIFIILDSPNQEGPKTGEQIKCFYMRKP